MGSNCDVEGHIEMLPQIITKNVMSWEYVINMANAQWLKALFMYFFLENLNCVASVVLGKSQIFQPIGWSEFLCVL